MNIIRDEILSKYTNIKIGGIARNFYIPESKTDLVDLIGNLDENYYLLAGGSNILINDKRCFENVILLTKFNRTCRVLENGKFYFGSSVRNSTMINFLNENGYGGLEFLISVPGTVGGAVVMNAGLGRKKKTSISDYITEVEVLRKGKIEIFKKEECNFSYRSSLFQKEDKIIVLGCYVSPKEQAPEVSRAKIKERIEYCKHVQDLKHPNLGTTFSKSNPKIMHLLRIVNFGSTGVTFSKKKNNWIVNSGKGTFLQAISKIDLCIKIHEFFNKDIEVEIKIWR